MTKKELAKLEIEPILKDLSMGVSIPEVCFQLEITQRQLQLLAERNDKLASHFIKFLNKKKFRKYTKMVKQGKPVFGGRDEKEVIALLEKAFSIGCSNKEACLFANISEFTYYDYTKKNPEVLARFNLLKEKPILKARTTIVKDLDSTDTAKWYMENKRSNEFSKKSTQAIETTRPDIDDEGKTKVLKLLTQEFDDD